MAKPTASSARDTRSEILALMLELLQTRGYHGFSYQDISDRLEIRKASIHYHFPTKEDAAVALLEGFRERFGAWAGKIEDEGLPPREALSRFFESVSRMSENHSRICPGGALAGEWKALPDRVRKEGMAVLALQRDWLRKIIKEGRASGEFRAEGTPEDQARFVLASVQGALQVSRSEGDSAAFRSVIRQLQAAITA